MDEHELKRQSEEHARKVGINLNPNEEIVNGMIKGLLQKKEKFGEIYCPCRIVTGDEEKDKEIICPCVFHRGEIELEGHCKCNLFVK